MGVGLVVLGHGEDGDEGDGAGLAQLTAGPLVDGGQVGIEVAGIAAAAGDLLFRRADLAQGFCVVRDIRQNDEHVHTAVEGEIFCGGQRHARRRDTLDRGVVGKVREQHRAVDGAGALKLH